MNPEKVYDCIVNFNARVRAKHVHHSGLAHRRNPPTGRVPAEYLRWANQASDDEVDRFWGFISEGKWRQAKRLSGLSTSVIADMMQAYFESNPSRSSGVIYTLCGIPVHKLLYLIDFELPGEHRTRVRRYINRRNAPPYGALPQRTRKAFEALSRLVEQEVKR